MVVPIATFLVANASKNESVYGDLCKFYPITDTLFALHFLPRTENLKLPMVPMRTAFSIACYPLRSCNGTFVPAADSSIQPHDSSVVTLRAAIHTASLYCVCPDTTLQASLRAPRRLLTFSGHISQ